MIDDPTFATNPLFAVDLIQERPWPIARHVLVIAEIGINHNGDLEIAKQLIDLANGAGCDAVKFQKRSIDIVYDADFLSSPRESPWGTTQRDQKAALEFDREEYNEIDRYCRHVGIDWLASAWDIPSLEFLHPYNLRYNKVASAMLTNSAFLEAVAEQHKPTFVSTGMADYGDVDRAVQTFDRQNCPIVLMHTVSEYPAPDERLSLRTITELRERYGRPVGYSGHEVGPIPGVIAAMMGAVAVERHITLDRAMYGSDQAASLEKRGLELLVGYLRVIPEVLGDGVKRITEIESENAGKLRYWMSRDATAPEFGATDTTDG